MESEDRIHHHPEVVFRDIGEGGVLLHAESGQYHELNAVGCHIWATCDGATTAEVIERIREAFPDAPAHVAEDVVGFVEGLEKRGLVTISAEPSP